MPPDWEGEADMLRGISAASVNGAARLQTAESRPVVRPCDGHMDQREMVRAVLRATSFKQCLRSFTAIVHCSRAVARLPET